MVFGEALAVGVGVGLGERLTGPSHSYIVKRVRAEDEVELLGRWATKTQAVDQAIAESIKKASLPVVIYLQDTPLFGYVTGTYKSIEEIRQILRKWNTNG
jgi:hypothetical protein